MLTNPEPILKQQKSEMTTNPLIKGKEYKIYKIDDEKKKFILIEQNIEFTQTIDEICYDLYNYGKIKRTRKNMKWLFIILVCLVIIIKLL